jgi:hypothetical protein
MGAALAERHAQAQLVFRLVAVAVGDREQLHGADVLLGVLGEMGRIIDAAEAGMDLLAIRGAPEQTLLKGVVLFRILRLGIRRLGILRTGETSPSRRSRGGEHRQHDVSKPVSAHDGIPISHDLERL